MRPGTFIYILICGITGLISSSVGISVGCWQFWAYLLCVIIAYICGTTVRR